MASIWPLLTWVTGTSVSKSAIQVGFRDFVPVYVANVAELRALSTNGTRAAIINGAMYVYDAADTTSTDDGTTVIVTADNARFKIRSATVADATETVKGAVELATAAETVTGTDSVRATHPAGVKAAIDSAVSALRNGVSASFDTLAELAAGLSNATNLTTGAVPAARFPAFTGDVTTTAGAVATTIGNNVVTNAKLATMAANTIKGNNTGSAANAVDMTVAQLKSLLGGLGTAAPLNAGTSANNLVQLDGSGRLPAVDGSQLTGIGSGSGGFVGQITASGGSTVPSGRLLCNGAAVSRTTYSALFTEIGTAFGTGDGSTTFNLPDLRGSFLRGLDGGRGVDTGRVLGTTQLDAIQAFTGTVTAFANSILASTGCFAGSTSTTTGSAAGANSGNRAASFSVTARNATETRPHNVAVNFFIQF